jgi:hypothetical protein
MRNRFALLVTLLASTARAEPEPPWEGASRAYAIARPFYGVRRVGTVDPGSGLDGALVDFGAEIELRSGLRLGFEETPLSIIGGRVHPASQFSAGWAGRDLALSLGVAGSTSWLYLQLGPSLRIGRLDRTHALVRIAWSAYPPQAVPAAVQLQLARPVARRLSLVLDAGGGFGQGFGVYFGLWSTLALECRLSGDGRHATTLISAGAGVVWMAYYLGPAVHLGVERRF